MYELLELLFEDIFSVMGGVAYHISDIIRIGILLFGCYIGWNVRRPLVFRLKLLTVFIVPMIITFLAWNSQYQDAVKDIASTIMAFLLMVLYWREIKDVMTSEGFYKNALSRIIERVPDMVWMKDLDGKITYSNEAASAKLFYLPHHTVIGKTCKEIEKIHQDKGINFHFDEKCGNMDQTVFDTSETKMHIECGYFNGRLMVIQVYNTPIYSKNKNKTVGLIGVAREITDYYIDHIKMKFLMDEKKYDDLKNVIDNHYEKTVCEETTCKIIKDEIHIL